MMASARSRRRDKQLEGLVKENTKLEEDVKELESAYNLHRQNVEQDNNSVYGLIRAETGGPRWQHGGTGKLTTYKSNKDLIDGGVNNDTGNNFTHKFNRDVIDRDGNNSTGNISTYKSNRDLIDRDGYGDIGNLIVESANMNKGQNKALNAAGDSTIELSNMHKDRDKTLKMADNSRVDHEGRFNVDDKHRNAAKKDNRDRNQTMQRTDRSIIEHEDRLQIVDEHTNAAEQDHKDECINSDKMLDLKSKVLKKASSRIIRRDTWAGPTDLNKKNESKSQDKDHEKQNKYEQKSPMKNRHKDSTRRVKVLHERMIPNGKTMPKKSDKFNETAKNNKIGLEGISVRRSRLDMYENSKVSNDLIVNKAPSNTINNNKPTASNEATEPSINSLVLENNMRKRGSHANNSIEIACENHLSSIYNNESDKKLKDETKYGVEDIKVSLKQSDNADDNVNNVKSDGHKLSNLEENSDTIVRPELRTFQTEVSDPTEIFIDADTGQIRVKPGDEHSLSAISDTGGTRVLIQQGTVNKSVDGQRLPCSTVDQDQAGSVQNEIRDIFGLGELNTEHGDHIKPHVTSVSPFALVKDCNSEVQFWLRGLGLPDVDKYVKIFADHEIDLLDLEFMTAAQLHDMGVTALGALDKILKGVKDLRSGGKTKISQTEQRVINRKQLPLSSIAWEEEPESKSKESARKSNDSDLKRKSVKKLVNKDSVVNKSKEIETAKKSPFDQERLSSAMSVHSDGAESISSSRSKVSNTTPSFSAGTKSSNAKCIDKRPPASKPNAQSKSKQQKTLGKVKKSDSNVSEKAGFKLSQMEGKPTKSVLLRQRSSSVSRDYNLRQRVRKQEEEKEVKGHNLRYRSRSAEAVKRKALEGVQTAAKRFEEKIQRDRENKQTYNLGAERVKAKRDEMAARHLQREKHKELQVGQTSDTEDEFQPSADSGQSVLGGQSMNGLSVTSGQGVQDASLESLVTVNILSPSGPSKQQATGSAGSQSDSGLAPSKTDVKKSLRRVEPARRTGPRPQAKGDNLQLNSAKISPIKTKISSKDTDKSPRSQSEPESGYKTDGSTSYSQIEDRVLDIQNKIKRLKARAGSGDDLTGTLVQDLQTQLYQFQQILGTRAQGTKGEVDMPGTSQGSKTAGKQTNRGLRRSASFDVPKSSPIESLLAEDETMNKDVGVRDDIAVRMSKRELLDEMRKEKKNHHLQIRQLQKELERIKHADPVSSMEIQLSDILYKQQDLIGEGAFSQVYKGLYQGSEVAVKKMKVPLRSQDKNYFTAELSLLKELRHPRVVLLIGVCTTDKHPVMVLEFMSRGSLYNYLHDQNNESLDHALYFQVAWDITAGMKYLHSHRPEVIHLDLKSMNVLLCQSYRAKIADFGFSKLRHDAGIKYRPRTKQPSVSTPAWMSPELLNKGEVTVKTDVYSFGVILWEMLTRQEPYRNLSVFQILERVRKNRRPEIPVSAPDGLQLLISQCWDPNPAKRPQFKEILQLLENLEFPPAWRELFKKAGVPDEALSNIHSTRNIIKLVADMLELKTLPEFMLKAKPRTGMDGNKSNGEGFSGKRSSEDGSSRNRSSGDISSGNRSSGNRSCRDDPIESGRIDYEKTGAEAEVGAECETWDMETVTTLSDGELSAGSDVTLQDLRESSADESSVVSSESNDDRSVTSSDLASTVVSVNSKTMKKRPVNVFVPSLELSIESARKEFSAERDRISRSSWMSVSLDDRTSSSLEGFTDRHNRKTNTNKPSETSLNLQSYRSDKSSVDSYRETDRGQNSDRNTESSRSSLSCRSAKSPTNTFRQDGRNANTKGPNKVEEIDQQLSRRSSSAKSLNNSLRLGDSFKDDPKSSQPNLSARSVQEDRQMDIHEDRQTHIHQLSSRNDGSFSPSSIVLTDNTSLHNTSLRSTNLQSLARTRRRNRQTESLGESNEFLMRESYSNRRPPSPKKRISITKKLIDKSINSDSDSARSDTGIPGYTNMSASIPHIANTSSHMLDDTNMSASMPANANISTQSLMFTGDVNGSYDSFFGIQSNRDACQDNSSHKSVNSSTNLETGTTDIGQSNIHPSLNNEHVIKNTDIHTASLKRSQVYVVPDESDQLSVERKQYRDIVDEIKNAVQDINRLSTSTDVKGHSNKIKGVCSETNKDGDSELRNSSQKIKSGRSQNSLNAKLLDKYEQTASVNSMEKHDSVSNNNENKDSVNDITNMVSSQIQSSFRSHEVIRITDSYIEDLRNESISDNNKSVNELNEIRKSITEESRHSTELKQETNDKDDEQVAAFQQKPRNCSFEQAAVTRSLLKSKEIHQPAMSVLNPVKSPSEIKHDGGEQIRVTPRNREEKKKPVVTPRKSKMRSSQESLQSHDNGQFPRNSDKLGSNEESRLNEQGHHHEVVTPRKSKMRSSLESLKSCDSGHAINKSDKINNNGTTRLPEPEIHHKVPESPIPTVSKNSGEVQIRDNNDNNKISKAVSISTQDPTEKDCHVKVSTHKEDKEQKSQKSTKIRVKLRKDPLAMTVTRDCPSPVPPAPPPPPITPAPGVNLVRSVSGVSKSVSAFSKSVQSDATRLSMADELKHRISQRQSISEGIKVVRKDSAPAFKTVKPGNVIGTSKHSLSTSRNTSHRETDKQSANMLNMDKPSSLQEPQSDRLLVPESDDLLFPGSDGVLVPGSDSLLVPGSDGVLVPQQSDGLPSFVVQSLELQDQKDHLRSISKPHPDQLGDLSGASQQQLSSIADILRKTMMGRRIAMKEDADRVSQSFDSVATGWSVDLS